MTTNHTGSANKPGTRTRRHPQASPHVLALLHRAQHGDRDAFADLFLLTEPPSAVDPRGPVTSRDIPWMMSGSLLL